MHRPHRVAVLILEGALPLDVGIPAQVFAHRDALPYRLTMCGVHPGTVRSSEEFGFAVEHGLEAVRAADTVIVPGYTPHDRGVEPAVRASLQHAHRRGARIASICYGAFALADAGLLDGRRATTHWDAAAELARRHPRVDVDANVLFVDEGDILTSAGVAAGLDLCLHLVRRDLGVETANDIARRLVTAPYRRGGQAQFLPRSTPQAHGDALAATREWAQRHLQTPLSVATLAAHGRMSERTFMRRFTEDTGETPLRWVLRARLDAARALLERSDAPVDAIAAEVGLGTGANLRAHFRRMLHTSPSEYRRAFAVSKTTDPGEDLSSAEELPAADPRRNRRSRPDGTDTSRSRPDR